MSVAARSPSQCPAGRCTRWPRSSGALRVGAGQPVVEQAESDADAGGDGGGGVAGRVGLGLFQDRRGQGGVAAGEGLDDQPQGGDGQVAGVADGGEAGHVVPFDGAVECRLQGVQVGHVDVVDVDAFLGQQRRELAQSLLAQARA